jgi:hypothetical protein
MEQYGSRWPIEWLRERLAPSQRDWVNFAESLFELAG